MHFVGVDLAWGEHRPTGVAVLDDRGRLVHLSSRTTDETITGALASYVKGPCVVGIDAPLVVANDTGNRPGEAALNRDFGRFDAGAHPANRGKPEFAGTPRGARLAATLGLDIDPESTGRRRAIEVYPHPATIVLFGLGRTLKYKQRTGRTLPELREALLQLVRLVEGLRHAELPLDVSGSAAWRELVAAVEHTTSKSGLRLAEDQVDAVLCAYVAMFAHRLPERTTTYGDLATGYIVTPTLPEGQRPAPRRSGSGEALVQAAVREYAERYPETTAATEEYVGLVTTLLDDAGINYLTVSGRTKSVASFAGKANRLRDGRPVYRDPLREITDQIGVRVITYVLDDVAAVAELLADQLSVLDDRDMAQETALQGRFGYSSRHLLVALGDNGLGEGHPRLRDRRASVQVRTVLQHAWAEFEHEIRYKGTVPEEHGPDLDRRFTLAAGLLELADQEFATIRERLRAAGPGTAAPGDPADPRISAQDLAAFLSGQYAEAGWSRTEHYGWISGLLLELGITSLEELAGLLASVDSAAIDERMGYRYPPGAVRRLDDALLAVFGERYLGLHGNAGRVDLLRARLARLRGETAPGDPEG
jgi:predicted RNase H-like nuclease/ppGpp synthetase/RelA/SpoT-type nucleotidyltranferase